MILILICALIHITCSPYVDVSNINLPSKGYLIHLPHRKDRLVEFKKHVRNCNLQTEIEIFKAVNGNELELSNIPITDLARHELEELERTGYRSRHYQLTKGAIGCYLSHVQIWEKCLSEGHDSCLILEDDAYLPKDFTYKTKVALRDVNPDFDILVLGLICNECTSESKLRKVNRFWQTHAYIIKANAIRKIMKHMFPISQQIDAQLSDFSNTLKIYAASKNIATPNLWVNSTDIQAPLKNIDGKAHNSVRMA
jgi:GR25 family glycosyltransferase involved in LPS biosynthesis